MTIEHFILVNQLRQADVIVLRKKFFGMLDHFAVFLGYHQVTGEPLFAANYTKGTRMLEPKELEPLLAQLIPERIERFIGTEAQRENAVLRAISLIGQDNYNYFTNNCEHYKNFVQKGMAYSEQANNFGNGLIAGVAILFIGALLNGE